MKEKQNQLIRFCMISLFTLYAGASFAQISYGARLNAGMYIDYFKVKGIDVSETTTTMALGIGGYMRIPISDKISLQPELNYFMLPVKPFDWNKITLPILLNYSLNSFLELEAGPSVDRDFSFSQSNAEIDNFQYPDINLGANAGIIFWGSNRVSANLRYSYEVIRTRYKGYPSSSQGPYSRQTLAIASICYKIN